MVSIGFIIFISYLIGSIPFAYIIAKRVKGIDIRYLGDGNVGARNVMHTVGKKYGIIAGTLDYAKGFAVCILIQSIFKSSYLVWIGGFSVFAGDTFPIFLKGRGGRGEATVLGFLTARFPIPTALVLITIGILSLFRANFVLASGIALSSLPLVWLIIARKPLWEIMLVILLLSVIGIKHLIDVPRMKKLREGSLTKSNF